MQPINPAFNQRNVRTAWVKTFKDGGQKPSWLRQAKARREVPPCVTYTGIAAQLRAVALGIVTE